MRSTASAPRRRRETTSLEPLSPYGTAKLASEEYLRTFNRLYGLNHVSLRYGNVYGPRQDPHGEAGVVAIFLGAALRGEQPRIFGDGSQTRDYVYVGDVARATLAALGHEGGVFNVGTGRETSVTELWERCRAVSGLRDRRSARAGPAGRAPAERPRPDARRERARLPGDRRLDEGLRATWDWIGSSRKD